MIEIYCMNCKYFVTGRKRVPGGFLCPHPNHIKIEIINNYYEERPNIVEGLCYKFNKHNNCKFFEEV